MHRLRTLGTSDTDSTLGDLDAQILLEAVVAGSVSAGGQPREVL